MPPGHPATRLRRVTRWARRSSRCRRACRGQGPTPPGQMPMSGEGNIFDCRVERACRSLPTGPARPLGRCPFQRKPSPHRKSIGSPASRRTRANPGLTPTWANPRIHIQGYRSCCFGATTRFPRPARTSGEVVRTSGSQPSGSLCSPTSKTPGGCSYKHSFRKYRSAGVLGTKCCLACWVHLGIDMRWSRSGQIRSRSFLIVSGSRVAMFGQTSADIGPNLVKLRQIMQHPTKMDNMQLLLRDSSAGFRCW